MKKLNKKDLNKIIELIESEDYQGVLNLLNTKGIKDKKGQCISLLIVKLLQMLKTGEIPKNSNKKTSLSDDILELIKDNNFKVVLQKIKSEEKRKENDGEIHRKYINIISMLIFRINKEIARQEIENGNDPEIEAIMKTFGTRKINNIRKELDKFLGEKDIVYYKLLIMNLIFISFREKNRLDKEIEDILYQLKYGVFVFDVTSYLRGLCICIKSKKEESAQYYLEILKKYILDNLLSPETFQELEEAIDSIKQEKEQTKQAMMEFLLSQLDILKESGSHILIVENPISKKERDIIYQIIRDNPGFAVKALSIGEEPKRLVLRALEPDSKYQTTDDRFYSNLYLNGKYQEYIEITTSQLKSSKCGCHRAIIYAYLGLSYYHIGNLEEALKCLTIAIEFEQRFGLEEPLKKEVGELLETIKKIQTAKSSALVQETASDYQKKREIKPGITTIVTEINSN